MNIRKELKNTIEFRSLNIGDVFESNSIYVKIDDRTAFDFSSKCTVELSYFTKCFHYTNTELVLR